MADGEKHALIRRRAARREDFNAKTPGSKDAKKEIVGKIFTKDDTDGKDVSSYLPFAALAQEGP